MEARMAERTSSVIGLSMAMMVRASALFEYGRLRKSADSTVLITVTKFFWTSVRSLASLEQNENEKKLTCAITRCKSGVHHRFVHRLNGYDIAEHWIEVGEDGHDGGPH